MKILILNGSPRRDGNTDILLRHLEKGILWAGYTAQHVHLAELSISGCLSCGACQKTGKCLIQDDMEPLYAQLEQAERIVLASPVYFYSVSAQTKAFIDRCQALWNRKYTLRQEDKKKRKGYLISVAARFGDKTFEGMRLTVRYAFDAMNCGYSGELLVRGVDAQGSILSHLGSLYDAEQLGIALCS